MNTINNVIETVDADPKILIGFNKVIFIDYTKYEPGMYNDPEKCGFWETYTRIPDTELWKHTYGCTNDDLGYCPICGEFIDHSNLENEEVEVISTQQLVRIKYQFEDLHIGDQGFWLEMR